ncbi:Ubiquinone/menaquinone biosynthesis C-methyltransferase UbiE [Phytophthora citrophthora]|uniref:Ubiquinone/menaquinone biosynthesis C-methyltransferase UbiE n=1 Tax=Phytophthora citrophthora TaxID=4793 RepID=A0AAD9GK32_9STRA|nr:Ubiquinone/menaquinone biosynthesis C-methyltransferase UbiE [Phytophthora citrophthora]
MDKTFTNTKWSAHAKTYSSVFSTLTARWAVDSLQIAQHEILQKLQKHEAKNSPTAFHFLDVGCGPGVLSFEFARRFLTAPTEIRITASDLSDGMLQQLNDTLEADSALNPFAPKFTTLQCDGMELEPLADASVDVVGSNFGLGIFPNRSKGWKTAHRVLKEDGLLLVTTWSEKSSQMAWFDKITDMFNAAEGEGEPLEHPSLAVGTDQVRVLKELQAAGFKDVKMYRTTHTIVFDDPNGMIQANMNNPVITKFMERLTKEQLEKTLVDLVEKDAHANFYQEGAQLDSADSFADGQPRLIPFIGFTILARK